MKAVWNFIRKVFLCIFDPISNILGIDLGAKESVVLTWHNVLIFIISAIIAIGFVFLYIYVLK